MQEHDYKLQQYSLGWPLVTIVNITPVQINVTTLLSSLLTSCVKPLPMTIHNFHWVFLILTTGLLQRIKSTGRTMWSMWSFTFEDILSFSATISTRCRRWIHDITASNSRLCSLQSATDLKIKSTDSEHF